MLGTLILLLYVNNYSEKLEGQNYVVQLADDTIIFMQIWK